MDPIYTFDFNASLTDEINKFNKMFSRLNQTIAFPALLQSLWYSTLPCYDVKGISADKDGEMAILKYCEWKGMQVPCKINSKIKSKALIIRKSIFYKTFLKMMFLKTFANYLQVLLSSKHFQQTMVCAALSTSMQQTRSSMMAYTHPLLMNFKCMTSTG
jgi:hypothetical protein